MLFYYIGRLVGRFTLNYQKTKSLMIAEHKVKSFWVNIPLFPSLAAVDSWTACFHLGVVNVPFSDISKIFLEGKP